MTMLSHTRFEDLAPGFAVPAAEAAGRWAWTRPSGWRRRGGAPAREIRAQRRRAAEREPVWRMVLEARTEPFVLLLLAAGVGAVLLGEVRDGLLVLVGLMPIVGADVVTEYRGERALEALRDGVRAARAGPARRVGSATCRRRSSCRATSCCSGAATSSRPTCG